jgi:hypothetical protein
MPRRLRGKRTGVSAGLKILLGGLRFWRWRLGLASTLRHLRLYPTALASGVAEPGAKNPSGDEYRDDGVDREKPYDEYTRDEIAEHSRTTPSFGLSARY